MLTTPPRLRKMASRAAELSVAACQRAVLDAGLSAGQCADAGCFLGVGASGGAFEEFEPFLAASAPDGQFDPEALASRGLQLLNPLYAFQLMNNFALCHAAIACGLQGPNGAYFSRGSGTVHAVRAAAAAVAEGLCPLALAGGADSALHPVTRAELARDGEASEPLGEGAAWLVLGRDGMAEQPLAWLMEAQVVVDARLAEEAERWVARFDPDCVVVAAWSAVASAALRRGLGATLAIETLTRWGNCLAGLPALALCVALDAAVKAGLSRVLVLSAGVDGDLGVCLLHRSRP